MKPLPRLIALSCLHVTLILPLLAGCATSGGSMQQAVIRAKEKVAPALVHVRPIKEVFRRGRREEVAVIGSGFLISSDGYVVTNEHVAGESTYVRCVLSDKNELDAEIVGVDTYTDIAVLKLKTDRNDLPYVKFGQSSQLRAGQTVIALGSPHGLARSVSSGIVSVTDRYLEGSGDSVAPYNNWIQTDAAINPGNSGGPLVNLAGEVIGINTRKLNFADNLGFAIPADIAQQVIADIIKNGRVVRSDIGVRFQEMTRKTDDPAQHGVVIADVDPLSPAYDARIQAGDVLLAVNGEATDARFIEDLPAIRKMIADYPVGDTLDITVMRDGVELQFPVETVEKSQRRGEEIEFEAWGCTISELTPAVIRAAQLTSKTGVLLSGTQVGGVAANARLNTGDIILSIDDQPVKDLSSFQATYADLVATKKALVLLRVKRGALTRFVMLKQEIEDDQSETSGDS